MIMEKVYITKGYFNVTDMGLSAFSIKRISFSKLKNFLKMQK